MDQFARNVKVLNPEAPEGVNEVGRVAGAGGKKLPGYKAAKKARRDSMSSHASQPVSRMEEGSSYVEHLAIAEEACQEAKKKQHM